MDAAPTQNIPLCTQCHVAVRPADYFCFNCGKELHPKPRSLSTLYIIGVLMGSVFLPPLGIIWGLRYVKEQDSKSKTVGVLAIAITIVVLVIVVISSIQFIQLIEDQVNSQLQTIQKF